MVQRRISFIVAFFIAIYFLLSINANSIYAADTKDSVSSAEKLSRPGETPEGAPEEDIDINEVKKETEKAKIEAEKAKKEAEVQKRTAELEKKKLETEIRETEAAKKAAVLAEKGAKTTEEVKEAVRKTKIEEGEDKLARERAAFTEEKMKVAAEKARIAEEELKISQEKLALAELKIKYAKQSKSFFEKAVESAMIIIIGLLIFLLVKVGLKKFENALSKKDVIRESESTLRIKTAIKLFNWLGSIGVFIIVVYMVLENHGFNIAPLLAGAGIVGLAFGFGGQYLIRDLINGLFILLEGQYRINDVVKIEEHGGLVEDINLRITTLRDLAGRMIIIPNGEVKTVINYTRDYAQALLDVGVAYKEDVDKVMDVIKEIGKEMRQDRYFGRLILDDLEMFGVDDFADSQVTIKFRMKTLPIKQWEVMREFRRRLKNRFDELGIEIPFPHRTLYWGTGKDNEWVKLLADQMAGKPVKKAK